MDPLFYLPDEVWRYQVLDFLTLLDMVKVSNSFLNCELQRKFLSLTNGCTQKMVVRPNQEKMLDWCLDRNLLTTNVFISQHVNTQSAPNLLGFVARVTRLTQSSCSMQFIDGARKFFGVCL